MKKSNKPKSGMNRREALKGATAASLGIAVESERRKRPPSHRSVI